MKKYHVYTICNGDTTGMYLTVDENNIVNTIELSEISNYGELTIEAVDSDSIIKLREPCGGDILSYVNKDNYKINPDNTVTLIPGFLFTASKYSNPIIP